MKTKNNITHTQGPWEMSKDFEGFRLTQVRAKGELIASVSASELTYGTPEYFNKAEANTKLISAAPELLNALMEVLAYEERCANKGEPKIGNRILSIIRKAINKATNKETQR